MVVQYWFPSNGAPGALCDGDPDETMTFTTGGCVIESSRVTEVWDNTVPGFSRHSFAVRLYTTPPSSLGFSEMWMAHVSYPTVDCNGASFDDSSWPIWGGVAWDCSYPAWCDETADQDDGSCYRSMCNETADEYSASHCGACRDFHAERYNQPNSHHNIVNHHSVSSARGCSRKAIDGIASNYILVEPTSTTTAAATQTEAVSSTSSRAPVPFLWYFLGLVPALWMM